MFSDCCDACCACFLVTFTNASELLIPLQWVVGNVDVNVTVLSD
ncbi:hypothetical protein T01_14418 [Trichinella spiralis]|uniref:Uncharacterized protein n=1 Tax=Trichinella spiralis TaxID=6334 RepID=A0A0V0Z5G6_TRISP|nr:hypothetical protein T01_14418 [Trichinella spiralis]